jgi:Quinohemoprotein amine dehydrogenase, gamma subunit
MKHLSPVNEKARFLARAAEAAAGDAAAPESSPQPTADVVALQQQGGPPQQPPGPHVPLGCSTIFSPGWEVDRTGGTAGLCQPVERDLFDCHLGCFWPAQVPDQLNHAPDWTKKCAAAQKDWRKIDLIFP